MTKEEVLKAVTNHTGEIRGIVAAMAHGLTVLVQQYKPEVSGEIDAYKDMMDTLKDKADEIKDILDEWS